MRPIKELLIILKNYIEEGNMYCGLCKTASKLFYDEIIDGDERNELLFYLRSKRKDSFGHPYWWPMDEIEPRIEFLDELINELDITMSFKALVTAYHEDIIDKQKEEQKAYQLRKEEFLKDARDKFCYEFRHELPAIEASGIEWVIKHRWAEYPLSGCNIEFTFEGEKAILILGKNGTYQFYSGRDEDCYTSFGRWPKREFILWLAEELKIIKDYENN